MGSKITLSEQIYQELYRDITRQRYRFGQKLPLKELKERFHVSQTPIREALTRLIEDGLLDYCSNVSVSVIRFTEADIRELYQCISELDALAILFCKNAFSQAPLIYDLEQIVKTGNEFFARGDIESWRHYSDEAHIVFYRHAQNRYLDGAAKKLRAKIDVLSNMYYFDDPVHTENINEGHKAILQCIQDQDFDEAANIMRIHLQFNMVYALNAYKNYQENEKPAK